MGMHFTGLQSSLNGEFLTFLLNTKAKLVLNLTQRNSTVTL